MIYDIFVNCKWVDTRWQQYSTHLHTNNTQNDTKQTIRRTTQKFKNQFAVNAATEVKNITTTSYNTGTLVS
jgi:hypothetical protein